MLETVLSIAAFILSVFGVAWTLWDARLSAPRVSVTLEQKSYPVYGSVADEIGRGTKDIWRVVVINHGARPVWIRNVGLRRLDNGVDIDVESAATRTDGQTRGPAVPVELPGRGVLIWMYGDGVLSSTFARGDQARAWASFYGSQPWRLRPQPQLQVRESAGVGYRN